jgi:carbonic anhydrase/acetyltransferase-like protein (isoleucine patch superfamily)
VAIYALGDHVPQIHPDAYVHPDATVIGRVVIGANSTVWPGAVVRGDLGDIQIGARTSVQDGTVLHTTEDWPTVIGDDCVIGHNVHMEGCTIENRCRVGSGSIVLNRAVVGERTVVGAQEVLSEDTVVPAGSLALGIPARARPVDPAKQQTWIDFAVREYVANGRSYARDLRLIASGHPAETTEGAHR